jgi:hypothetical protein
MEITRIKAPKFRVGRYVLNEYEFRNLQLEVALGVKPAGIKVTDAQGNRAVIEKSGCLSDSLEGLALAGEISFEILKVNHRKGE